MACVWGRHSPVPYLVDVLPPWPRAADEGDGQPVHRDLHPVTPTAAGGGVEGRHTDDVAAWGGREEGGEGDNAALCHRCVVWLAEVP